MAGENCQGAGNGESNPAKMPGSFLADPETAGISRPGLFQFLRPGVWRCVVVCVDARRELGAAITAARMPPIWPA
jgi:hypothetical protein